MAEYTERDAGILFDNFGRPEIYNANKTLINNLITLLSAKPGNFPSQPDLGIDICRYLMSTPDQFNPSIVKAQIVAQCSDFRACVEDGTFDIILKIDPKTERPFILVLLPIWTEETNERAFIGVRLAENNEQIYRLFIDKDPETIASIEAYFS